MRSAVKKVLRSIAQAAFGPYRFIRVYRLESLPSKPGMPPDVVFSTISGPPSRVADNRLRDRAAQYTGKDAFGFGLYQGNQLVASCWFWGHLRFQDPLVLTLGPNEAMLVDLHTAAESRGKGLAPVLVAYASGTMRQSGFQNLYTWVWHNHRSSCRVFEKTGWRQVAWALQFHLGGRGRRPLSVRWRPLLTR